MASFQAKIGCKRTRKEGKKIILMGSRLTCNKNYKKIQKIKNPVIASFQAKISWERPRKRKNKKKKIVPMSSYPTCNEKFQKNSKKIQKIRKNHHIFFSSQNRMGNAEKRRKLKKKNSSDGFLPNPEQKILKKIAKKFKKLENIIIACFQAKIHCERSRKREN